ncbi:Uncharacterised protein [Mycobacteroides abscessus subsp. abscessus]|nr:Uncharacterised protein [Mycobacteroides abscessus subsp. abscessus]
MAPEVAMTRPDRAARMVTKATAATNANRIPPPRVSASWATARLPPLFSAAMAPGPTRIAAP